MQNKKVLVISSEVIPYLPQSERSINSFKIPKSINDAGGQTRIFMPRYGLINERRHQPRSNTSFGIICLSMTWTCP